MTTYGVTPTGFVLKPVTVIAQEIAGDVLGEIDAEIDVSPAVPLGQLIGILARQLGKGWEILQVAYNATNRGDAEDALLDNIGDLTGTKRAQQSPSYVPCNVNFSLAGTYVAGSLVAFIQGSPTIQWTNVETIVVPSTGGDGSPIGTSHLWPGPLATIFLFKSMTNGPTAGDALIAANTLTPHQLNQRVPVAGWVSVVDAGNVILGAFVEEDTPYRLRQRQELASPGNNTLDATRAAILKALENALAPVSGAFVQMYENTTLLVDPVTGLPPRSFMAVVFDDGNTSQNDQLIAQAVWANKPGGMQSFGTTNYAVPDGSGVLRTVSFTRASVIPVSVGMDVYVDSTMGGPERAALVSSIGVALASASQGKPFTIYGSTFTPDADATTTLIPGRDVIANAFKAIVQGQDKVRDVQNFVFTSPTPDARGNVFIDVSQVGKIQTVVVTTHDFVP